MEIHRRKLFIGLGVGAIVVAAVVTVVLAFPAWLRDTSPVDSRTYASWSDAPSRAEDAAAARPDWAPQDATDIHMTYRVRNVPGWDVAMTAPGGLDTTGCSAVTTTGYRIALPASFMPDVLPDRAWTCGDGRIVWQDGDRVYGATPDHPLEG